MSQLTTHISTTIAWVKIAFVSVPELNMMVIPHGGLENRYTVF